MTWFSLYESLLHPAGRPCVQAVLEYPLFKDDFEFVHACAHDNKGSLQLRYWLENALEAKILTGKKWKLDFFVTQLNSSRDSDFDFPKDEAKCPNKTATKNKKFAFQNRPRWSTWCPLRMCQTSGFSSRRSAHQCARWIQRIWRGLFGLKGNWALIISIFEI